LIPLGSCFQNRLEIPSQVIHTFRRVFWLSSKIRWQCL